MYMDASLIENFLQWPRQNVTNIYNDLAGSSEGHKSEQGEDDSPGQDWDPPQVLQSETGCHPHQEPAVQHSAPVGEDRFPQCGANQAPREGLQGSQTGEG